MSRVIAVGVDRLELVDDADIMLAVARRSAGDADVWIVRRQSSPRVEWIRGELATRARLQEIGDGDRG